MSCWLSLCGVGRDVCSEFIRTWLARAPFPINHSLLFHIGLRSGREILSLHMRSLRSMAQISLGLTDSLPALVRKKFLVAKAQDDLLFSATELTVIRAGDLPVRM